MIHKNKKQGNVLHLTWSHVKILYLITKCIKILTTIKSSSKCVDFKTLTWTLFCNKTLPILFNLNICLLTFTTLSEVDSVHYIKYITGNLLLKGYFTHVQCSTPFWVSDSHIFVFVWMQENILSMKFKKLYKSYRGL